MEQNGHTGLLKKSVATAERTVLNIIGTEWLSFNDIDNLVQNIADDVVQDDFKPDCIVGILRGGKYPAKKLAEILDLPYEFADVARSRDKIWGIEIRDIMFISKLMKTQIYPTIRDFSGNIDGYERILIIDDDCGSGVTLDVAEEILREHGAKEFKRAALLVYPNRYHPDYWGEEVTYPSALIKTRKRFPWKTNSPYYQEQTLAT